MIIETTLYVRKGTLARLSQASEKIGRSRTSLLVLLLKRTMKDSYRLVQSNRPVRYQKKSQSQDWHRLHIRLKEYEYEYCLDMRKFFKMSVSLIIAYAVSKYLDELIYMLSDTKIITDNYHYKSYLLIREVVDSAICWKIYWGIPYKLDKVIPSMTI